MRTFFVCGLSEVANLALQHQVTHVISMLGQHEGRPRTPSCVFVQDHLRMQFEDLLDSSDPGAPTQDHVKQIFDWVDQTPADARILVHCFAGISRSTSIALALHWRESKNLEASAKWLVANRPQSVPNELIAHHVDNLLNAKGEFLKISEKIVDRRINWLSNN